MNILNILKDKPKGTKLYSPICGECTLVNEFPITVLDSNKAQLIFYNDGTYNAKGECLLFPSNEMRNWNKYLWKKGDVLTNGDDYCIFNHFPNNKYNTFIGKFVSNTLNSTKITLITEDWTKVEYQNSIDHYISSIEQKYNGKLNLETLEIEKKEHEFKDGDIVYIGNAWNEYIGIIKNMPNGNQIKTYAHCHKGSKEEATLGLWLNKNDSDDFRLTTDSEKQQIFDALAKENKAWDAEKKMIIDLPKKHELKPFEKVLVRDNDYDAWNADFFECLSEGAMHPYRCIRSMWKQCIPYKGNEHLLNTTNSPTE